MSLNRAERRAMAATSVEGAAGKKAFSEALRSDQVADAANESQAALQALEAMTPDENAAVDQGIGKALDAIVTRIVARIGHERFETAIGAKMKAILRSDFIETTARVALKATLQEIVEASIDGVRDEILERVHQEIDAKLELQVQAAVQAVTANVIAEVKRRLGT